MTTYDCDNLGDSAKEWIEKNYTQPGTRSLMDPCIGCPNGGSTNFDWMPSDAPVVWPVNGKRSDKLEFLRRQVSALAQEEGLSHVLMLSGCSLQSYLNAIQFELAQAVMRAKEEEGKQ